MRLLSLTFFLQMHHNYFESIDENWLQLFELNEELSVESVEFWNTVIENPAAFDFETSFLHKN